MSAPLVHLVTPCLALLAAAIDDPAALRRALGSEVAEAWDVSPKALRLTRHAVVADPEVAPRREGRGLAAVAVRELLCEAFAAPDVRTVLAPTLGEPGRSVRVLEKARFVQPGGVPDDEVDKASRPRLDRTEAPWQHLWLRGQGAGRCHRQPLGAPTELKIAARRCKPSCVSAARTMVRLATARRSA
jgi:hypothetical protein